MTETCDTKGCEMPACTTIDAQGHAVKVCVRCEEKGRKTVEQKIREGILNPKTEAKSE